MPHSNGGITPPDADYYAERFCEALSEIGVSAAALTADGTLVAVNQRFCEITVGLPFS
jgi:hypothetical protein